MAVTHPKVFSALALASLASGALLLSAVLPAAANPGLSASGTGTVMTQLSDLTAPTSNSPQGVAVASGVTYVSNPPTHSVLKFDSAGSYLGEIALPGASPFPTAMVASSDGSKVYVCDDNATGLVFTITTATDAVTSFSVATQPFAITLSPDNAIVYLISNSDSLVYAYDASTGSSLGHSVSDGLYATATHVLASPDGTKVYESLRDPIPAPGQTTGGLRVLNASDLSEIDHADLPNAGGLAESADGSRVWVGSTDSANQSVVAEYDPVGTFVTSVAVSPSPNDLILSPDHRWLYVAAFSNGLLDVIDTASFTDTATAMTIGDGRELAISSDGLRLYSASSTSATKVISIAKLTLTSPASVPPGTGPTAFSAQITDGGATLADYTTNTVKFDILDSSNMVVATATVAPNAAGAASASIDLSALPAGTYSVRATLDPIDGTVVVTAAGFRISAAALAATGTEPVVPTVIGLLLLVAGSVALVARRRRTA